MPWKSEYGHQIRQELFQCYQAQDWMGFVGTQFDKKILSQDMTRNTLGLSSDRKVALIFPHILWDGSFFFGEDLFDDYTEWLVETIRAAVANPRLQWVVKLHPAHVVKTKQGNYPEKPAELKVIEQVFGTLPAHLKLVYPDTEISTYSLLEIADYTITVRGTVGIEAALFGIPVVTAGYGTLRWPWIYARFINASGISPQVGHVSKIFPTFGRTGQACGAVCLWNVILSAA
jgi:capsule polysaccharide export protein KpsC/LpsZ